MVAADRFEVLDASGEHRSAALKAVHDEGMPVVFWVTLILPPVPERDHWLLGRCSTCLKCHEHCLLLVATMKKTTGSMTVAW